ncbi:hypothetical protein [Paractinoplanes lichenicola]|uniref:Uncharacterized protein n=1 Tax=Paractinoplanes lichenicola TaxID=2802976 RepID=A0ABS1W5A4_9ACTN|nr:hypothetical protein [Actinoplanes lichenicola]MBL7261907.1 hypothetical protein [Actinoplanes lichenicola]
MAWTTSTSVREFLDAAGGFLRARPIDHTMLLTEAAYLEAVPTARDQLYGWWSGGGAFLRAPGHAPIVSLLPDEAWGPLAALLPGVTEVGVDARSLPGATAAWPGLGERFRVSVCRARSQPVPASGRARKATPDDRDLLVGWYHELMAANPGDPSELAYVVDFPITYGGLMLWETEGEPTAMASRTPVIGGVTRVGAAYGIDAAAALAAVRAEAATVASDVLTLTTAEDCAPVLQRVTLGTWTSP